jgi:hypothetical protein
MPSKSDSAGKLHQYFTCKQLELKCSAKCITPLDDDSERGVHVSSFTIEEINSLKRIGELTAETIISHSATLVISVEDIGVSSGAVGHENTDDLVIRLETGNKLGYSLKCAKGISQILSKNMGAKSLIRDYFSAEAKQVKFNAVMEETHLRFLNTILHTNINSISVVKKRIREDVIRKGLSKARFSDDCYEHANEGRNRFLRSLRNELLKIIVELNRDQLANAANLVLDTGKNHLLADYNHKKEKVNLVYIPIKKASDILKINERGNDSVTIKTTDYIIGFRYKFESGILSSIKLVGDYKRLTN